MTSKRGSKNILGGALQTCSTNPMTGWFRDGCCETQAADRGRHLVCAVMTAEFLAYSKSVGNDLSTPMPHYNFPGLKAGDQWCLCLERWKEAHAAGCAPKVVLEATHQIALERVPLAIFETFAVKGNAS